MLAFRAGLSALLIMILATLAIAQAYDNNDTAQNDTNATILNETEINETINATGELNITVNITENVTEENATVNETMNETEEEAVAPENETNGTAEEEENATAQAAPQIMASLYVKAWYPKGPDYVFVCNVTGFTPTAYSWWYGDGHKLINITNGDTYHVYESLGNHTVACIGTDGNNSAGAAIDITVTSLIRPGMQPQAQPNVTEQNQTPQNQTQPCVIVINQTVVINQTANETPECPPCILPVNQTNQTNQTFINVTQNATANVTMFSALLTGEDEVPPVDTNATGEANATLNGSILTVTGAFRNLTNELWQVSGSPAHIHFGLPNQTGPIAFVLDVEADGSNTGGNFSLATELTGTEAELLMNGSYYINVHSENYPSGEIRGQVTATT